MKALHLFLTGACCLIAPNTRASLITIFVQSMQTTNLVIGTNETAELLSFPASTSTSLGVVTIAKSGIGVRYHQASKSDLRNAGQLEPLIVVGPATLHFSAGGDPICCTFRLGPEQFPPDKTIVIPEGGGANITMECSTNLIDWTSASLGVYTNIPANKFFRLRAERVP